jgi:Integral membrane protein CcmA involved in cell shape determination
MSESEKRDGSIFESLLRGGGAAAQQTEAVNTTTYLAPGTFMVGKLKAPGDVEIAGDFKGSVTAGGNVIIHSNINGDVTAARTELVDCKLTGDIRSSSSVAISEKSAVEGNVYGTELVCSGKIKGDIQMNGNSVFQGSAVVEGNITTGTMSVERGAAITGSLAMGVSGKDAGGAGKAGVQN